MADNQSTSIPSDTDKKLPLKSRRERWLSPRVRIHVTADIIDEATRRDSSHCMLAESVRALVPEATYISIDLASIRWSDPTKGLRYTFLTPRVCQKAIIDFDNGTKPNPFGFELRNAHVTIAGWNATHSGKSPSRISPRKRKQDTQELKTARVSGTTRIGGRAIPRTGIRREFGLRAFQR